MSITKCKMLGCGKLNCEHNYAGQCYNGAILLNENGSCMCYEKEKEGIKVIGEDPFKENSNLC